jgi:hypothetical protein
MLRWIGAYVFAAALLLFSTSAFQQMVSEFRDTEPGSLLFGLLQLVIGSSAVLAALGLAQRARWASRAIGIGGIAGAALLAVQPLYEPMPWDAMQGIWLGAAVVALVAAAASWCARRLARPTTVVRASDALAGHASATPVMLPDAPFPAEALPVHAERDDAAPVHRTP